MAKKLSKDYQKGVLKGFDIINDKLDVINANIGIETGIDSLDKIFEEIQDNILEQLKDYLVIEKNEHELYFDELEVESEK